MSPRAPTTALARLAASCTVLACITGLGCTKTTDPEDLLFSYRESLERVRRNYGGSREMPAAPFFLFGMGLRDKYLYRSGALTRLADGVVVEQWAVTAEVILPSEYSVRVTESDGTTTVIQEDQRAVWVEQGSGRSMLPGTEAPLELPRFEGHPYGPVLRVLHQEMLIGVLNSGRYRGGPVPNLFKFDKPWYRDAAIIANALVKTGNIDVIRPWISALDEPYDHNRSPDIDETDNLGQALYLLSLTEGRDHPLVPTLLQELTSHERNLAGARYVVGMTDGEEHAAYQTKWAKYGLQRLGLSDPYQVPNLLDGYSAVFWLDFRAQYAEGTADAFETHNFPYLGWAVDHFHGTRRARISNQDYPLTWEAAGTDDLRMDIVDPAYRGLTTPHAWHSAEAFLYLLEAP